MKFPHSFITIFFTLFINLSLFAVPTATITSTNVRICESGVTEISISLTGVAPWGLNIHIEERYADGTTSEKSTTINQINQSPFIYKYPVSTTTTFSISKIYDNTTSVGVDGNPNNTFTAYVDKMPKPSAGQDQVLKCGAAQLNGTIENSIHSIYWTNTGNGTFDDNTKPNAIFTPSEVGSYVLTINERNGSCIGKDDVNIDVQGIGSPVGTLSGSAIICKTGTLSTSVLLEGTGPFNYVLSNGISTIERTNIPAGTDNFKFNVEGNNSYKISNLVDKQGCIASAENKKGTATVVDNNPNTNAGEDLKGCGLIQTLNAVPSKGIGTWSVVSGEINSFSNINSATTTVNSAIYGETTLRWSENYEGCINSDDVKVRFDQQPTTAMAGKDITVYLQKEILLHANTPVIGIGLWSNISGSVEISEPTNPQSSLTILSDDTHQLKWTISNGECPSSNDTVQIIKQNNPPSGFSPNGDGKNDEFLILGGELIPNNQLTIFNSQGQIIITIKNDNNKNDTDTDISWDGYDEDGKQVKDGSYYYIFSGDGMETIKDYIVIKRN